MKKQLIKVVVFLLVFIIGGLFFSNEQPGGVAYAYDCSSLVSINVTTDKLTYRGGETISGNIVFTNNTTVSAHVGFTGKMYENDTLVYTNSVEALIVPGVNTFKLSNLFKFLDIYINVQGGYKLEVSASAPEATGCLWEGMAVVAIEPSSTPVTQISFPALAGVIIGAPHNYNEQECQQEIAKRDLAVLGLYDGWAKGGKTPAQVIQEIKSLNPDIFIGAYTSMTDISDDLLMDIVYRNKLDTETGPLGIGDWWAYDSNGIKTDWGNGAWGSHDVNITSFVTPDANGDRWPQWLAKKNYETIFEGTGFDFWYVDNNFWKPRSDADWNRDGTNDDRNDPVVQSWWRTGQRAYYDQAAEIAPYLYLMGNADNDLSGDVYPEESEPFDEYKNVLHGAFMENVMGVDWSVETWGSWDLMRQWYYKIFYNLLEPRVVSFGVFGMADDYQFFRYSFASCLMNNGYFSYSDSVNFESYAPLPWFDEYDLAGTATTKWLGKAIDNPPTIEWQNGVYRRRFENGMAIVNPKGNGTRTVTVEPGYYRISGVQDRQVNNGQAATTITLKDRDGIILMK
jgi:hypothetical protein